MQAKKIADNDDLIRELIASPDYLVLWSGEIMTRRDRGGHTQNVWRVATTYHKAAKSRTAYWRVKFRRKNLQAHRIVFQKFIGELNPALHINHKDGDGRNNCVDNLELVTASENGRHAYRVLGHKPVNGNAKITAKIAERIRKDSANGLPYSAICTKYGVSKGTVSGIVNKKHWKAS